MGDYFIKLNMWDTAGQERFRSLTPMFYRETDFIVLIYSVDNLQSFKSLASWCNSITTECVTQPTIVVVANKSDLESQRMVTTETGLNFAVEHGFDFIELSAKDQPDKINDLMNLIGKKCLTKIISKDVNEPTDVLVHAEKSSCC
ncbi:Ras family protein [Trichomonas vaginalis G3]|uniref:Ras family protein n=1 Tax=Trichomonas vaginalis (strain ATCC PRA-98 / G3) TaxID=412133 RepID=A2G6X1_TRIV3|nr:retrograde vesicle-mediated transport, Golgi to ER [Trichomonas vaginalis G3]EAX87098.1 Ras family protein [Trichomonas vaginalis G3]KAI5485058.1 retrograde vesicle-mediated transport, Golgi to ER [Trichomonas vaginalis G3]|eukprot:XP_001300028.1 Ras family protein [Trichomonas vaginalis G3]